MYNSIGKKALSLLLAVIMIFTLMPTFTFMASAAASGTHTPVEGITVGVSGATDNSMSDGAVTVTAQGSAGFLGIGASAKTATITIYNETDNTATVSFDWAATSVNELKIDGAVYAGDSDSFSKILSAGDSFVVTITTAKNGTTNKLVLSNFAIVEAAASSNVTVIYDGSLGSVTSDGTAINSGTTKNVSAADGTTLAATANSGTTFLGWIDLSTNQILSSEKSFTIFPVVDTSVKAIFVNENSAPHFLLGAAAQTSVGSGLFGWTPIYYYTVSGSYLYEDLTTAAAAAQNSASSKTIVLMNNATLPAGDYTIPSGVTMLIPFDSANTMYTNQAVSTGTYKTPTAYRTLTMANGANLTVNGAVSLSAQHFYAKGSSLNGGSPTGNVSFIKMQGSSNITVNNGGALYAYGFITGSGSVVANNGATVYENFQIMDFRGGTQSTDMENGVFPISQYYVQNIEVPLTLHYGAKEYSYTTIYMSNTDFGSEVAFIGTGSAMFNLASGYVTKYYDGATDRLVFTVNGNVTISSIKIDVGTNDINSQKYELPINSNITVTVESGNITVNQDLALLPGSQIIVNEGANCTLASEKNIYVYDADDWGNFAGPSNKKFVPISYAPGKKYTRTEADLKDAMIKINGTVNSSAGYVYTTAGGANICSDGTGVAIVKPGTQIATHQLVQNTGYTEIPLTSVKLKNADGTYTETTGVTGTFKYKNGKWSFECAHTYSSEVTAPSCTENGYTTYTCTACGDTYTEAIKATGHTEVIDKAVEPTYTKTGLTEGSHCSVCGEVFVAQETLPIKEVIAPIISSADRSTVTLVAVDGYEYSKDGINWQSSNVFKGLNLKFSTAYTFYQRAAATNTEEASPVSKAAECIIVPTSVDCTWLKKMLFIYDECTDPLADINQDGAVNIIDLVVLKKLLLEA